MSITKYIKEIGRGKDGARHLSREQAADLFGQLLDGTVTDLEVGAFCLAMRIKGETPAEMAGFLDATRQHLCTIATQGCPAVVLPSYNGARKLPVLTALLALLLARQGMAVVVHGSASEDTRISTQNVLLDLGIPAQTAITKIAVGEVQFVPTALLSPGLARLLDVRRVVGLRNSAHSLVKLLNPCDGPAVIVGSYTHPEYAVSMLETLKLTHASALLLRGTEGEPVADARRTPAMDAICCGNCTRVQEAQSGSLTQLPDLPALDAASTARWIQDMLAGLRPVPAPIAQQVEQTLHLSSQMRMTP
ncbi:DNA-binding protein YbiB [Rhodoferax sp.]|uniref:DNA-binding protein YbiB n=1 Tax=Rhodoferax sp. TaxID=50421 RepID=UPI00261CF4C1|nr:DNA-binding protein YbiB [Rhodoferax sp.]MDD2810198.1 DNA-binding protein YbiB [Rhodoferax sp.]MDD4943037.1 DNA-binding protein YbiB [Rhodoferax sp.]